MNKRITAVASIVFCFCMIVAAALPVYADEPEQTQPVQTLPVTRLTIGTAEEFLIFAENCRLDSYSRNLEVSLKADIDLSGTDFSGIPIFSGTFKGYYHTITGLHITGDGSVQGLFRYLTETALVQNLKVEGEVIPQGSRSAVGGIAGSNAGRIENCDVSGLVSGADRVGGIAGINTLTGIIEECSAEGTVHGNHFVGGMAGENHGVIRRSVNAAEINTTAQQNSVDISDITLDTLTGSEAANTVTDIGGIAGSSSGVIRSCENRGNVGYRQMGYNIGGIAGSQTGYLTGCGNYGKISGRKEVGGIVGQMEPTTMLEYEADTLQILQGQLDTMGSIAGQTASSAQSSAGALNSQMDALEGYAGNASDAIGMLIPDGENPELPDSDTILAAQNAISGSLSGMTGTLQGMAATTESAIGSLNSNLQALSNQMNTISATLSGASENLGGSITDVSDGDTAEDRTGKVEDCRNFGSVLADLNGGGIAGAISFENDFDPEDDLQISGSMSLNFESELRAVVLNCENIAVVTVNKQNAGGIVGRMALGLVRDCINTGAVEADAADYVGGIAGQSRGFIRGSSAKCVLSGSAYAGGIAGSGTIVSDCRSMVSLSSGTEKLGAVLGMAEESGSEDEAPVRGNFYLSVGEDPGGIDGISYAGAAEALSKFDFLALEALPELFRTVTVAFIFEDGTQQTVAVAPGGRLGMENIPAVPEKAGFVGDWEGLAETDLSRISFDTAFHAHYAPLTPAIESEALRENGHPVLLALGEFRDGQRIALEQAAKPPALTDDQTLIEAWVFKVPSGGTAQELRYALPQQYPAGEVRIMVLGAAGDWREVPCSAIDSYLAFAVEAADEAFCAVHAPADYSFVLLLAAAILIAVLVVLTIFLVRRGRVRKGEKA